MNSYQAYIKTVFATFHAEHKDTLTRGDIQRKMADAWKTFSEEEQQPYVEIARKSKEDTLRDWAKAEPEREARRIAW